MKLAIIAATGGVGEQLLRQALSAGHDVTAVVRNPAKLPAALREARVVTADLAGPQPGVLEAAIAGTDAVLSGLGPASNSTTRSAGPPPCGAGCDRGEFSDVDGIWRTLLVASLPQKRHTPAPVQPAPARPRAVS